MTASSVCLVHDHGARSCRGSPISRAAGSAAIRPGAGHDREPARRRFTGRV